MIGAGRKLRFVELKIEARATLCAMTAGRPPIGTYVGPVNALHYEIAERLRLTGRIRPSQSMHHEASHAGSEIAGISRAQRRDRIRGQNGSDEGLRRTDRLGQEHQSRSSPAHQSRQLIAAANRECKTQPHG